MKFKDSGDSSEARICDNSHILCRANDKASLPSDARLPINRCNLPAVVLGSLAFQRYPAELTIDGVKELHRDLFRRLGATEPARHAEVFRDYMTVHFQLERPEEAGFSKSGKGRANANYIRMIRGWSFNSDSREAAVLKGWVESRFGLLPRWHIDALRDPGSTAYLRYLEMRSAGIYGTNAIEAQLDLVYTYCQYALQRGRGGARHLTLYRGVNRIAEHEVLHDLGDGRYTVLLNNLNSFTCSRERACEFGDYILSVDIPLSKIFFYCGLVDGILRGEDEFLVLGGSVLVTLATI